MKTNVTLGIDIGGTNTVFGFVDEQGNMISESSIPTEAENKAEILFERLFRAVEQLKAALGSGYELAGIGIGAPNANYYKGTVEQPPNLNWGNVNVLEIVKRYSQLPAAITNDANAAAIGEMEFGAARGMKNFIVITLGTGLGSGIVINGQLLYGHTGFAGELGHVVYEENGRKCGCGKYGCLETYASAVGIRRTVSTLLGRSMAQSRLRNISFDDLSSKMIYDAAIEGDPIALEAFEYTGNILGKCLADFTAFSSPEAIILFGGLAQAGELIFKPTQKSMDENMLNIFKGTVKLLPSALTKGNTAVLGASALIWNEIKRMK